MIDVLNFSCQGESHKATDKVCQDFSLTKHSDGVGIAIVCDGHGGERYFRSNIGAQYAAEISLDAVSFLVYNKGDELFEGTPYTAVGPMDSIEDVGELNKVDNAFHRLFSSIIYNWNEKIKKHAKENDLTEWEINNVPKKYLDEFKSANNLEKQYGCTLMVYVQTEKYWFAFHLGDGKCLTFQDEPIWKEPIPWDERCFLNRTTSLCDSNAIEEFRYCYQGNGTFPSAVFLGSDGIDDSFGETENMANFYIQVLKMLAKEGTEKTLETLKEDLPQLSKKGSKDDMSIACVFNLEEVKNNLNNYIYHQINMIGDQLNDIEKKIISLKARKESLMNFADEKSKIDYDYAVKDIKTAKDNRIKLAERYNKLAEELPEGIVRYYQIEDEDDRRKEKSKRNKTKERKIKGRKSNQVKVIYYYKLNPRKRMSFKDYKIKKNK